MKILNLTETVKHNKPVFKMASSCSIGLRQVFCLGLALCLLLFTGEASRPVLAQPATTLRFSLHSVLIDTRVGSTAVMAVVIENADNIGGFDIQIDYDPNVALITEWTLGDFMPEAICFELVNVPGLLQVACAKTGTPGISSLGTLVELTFEATAWSGNSPQSFLLPAETLAQASALQTLHELFCSLPRCAEVRS